MPKLGQIMKVALVGIIGALFLVSVLSTQDITVNALDFSLGLQLFDQGYTVIDIPPLGTIRAKTHKVPLILMITLKNINLDRLNSLVSAQEPKQIFSEIYSSLRRQVTFFVIRIILVSFLGGCGAGFLLFRSVKKSLLAGCAGLLAIGILLGSTAVSYDESAFKEPEFEGIVEAAPWLMGVAEKALVAVNDLDSKMKIIADNLLVLFESLRYLGGGGTVDGELKILHVSDIHNNPIAVSLAKQIAVSFDADLIIDTGDATDYGTPIEADIVSSIADIGRIWIFVPGNHDSPSVIDTLKELDNVYVLQADVIYLEALDIAVAGVADPASRDTAMTIPTREEYKAAAALLKEALAQSVYQPSLIVAHNVNVVQEFTDTGAVLLHGHTHQVSIRTVHNSVVIDAGTSGGAGIRGLMTNDEIPYSMILLHLNRVDERWAAVAADIITVNQLDAGFVLERHLLRQPAASLPPETVPEEGEEPEQ